MIYLGIMILNNDDVICFLWPQACNFIKKETLTQMFSCKFYEIEINHRNK